MGSKVSKVEDPLSLSQITAIITEYDIIEGIYDAHSDDSITNENETKIENDQGVSSYDVRQDSYTNDVQTDDSITNENETTTENDQDTNDVQTDDSITNENETTIENDQGASFCGARQDSCKANTNTYEYAYNVSSTSCSKDKVIVASFNVNNSNYRETFSAGYSDRDSVRGGDEERIKFDHETIQDERPLSSIFASNVPEPNNRNMNLEEALAEEEEIKTEATEETFSRPRDVDVDMFYQGLCEFFKQPIDDLNFDSELSRLKTFLTVNQELKALVYKGKPWLHHAIDNSIERFQSFSLFIEMLRAGFSASAVDDSEGTTPLIYAAKKLWNETNRQKKPKANREPNTNKKNKYKGLPKVYGLIIRALLCEKNENIGINCKEPSTGKTALHYLIALKHNTEAANDLLKRHDLDLSTLNEERSATTFLHYAAQNCKNTKLFSDILRKLPSSFLNQLDDEMETPLHKALQGDGNNNTADVLIGEPGIDCNVRNSKGQTPLFVLCDKPVGSKKILQKILSKDNVAINDADNTGKTPFHVLCKNGTKSHVELFVHKADFSRTDRSGKTALFYSRWNSVVLEYMLRENLFDLTVQDEKKKTVLHYYCGQPDSKESVVKLFLETGDETLLYMRDGDDNRPLECAQNASNVQLYDVLTPKVYRVLKYIREKSLDEIESLLNQTNCSECVCSETSKSILHAAAERCQKHADDEKADEESEGVVKFVLSKIGEELVNLGDNKGDTPLHCLAKLPSVVSKDVVDLFIRLQGLDVNALNKEKKTPLHCAIEAGNVLMQKSLIESGRVNLCHTDQNEKSYLHYLCINGSTEGVLKCFLSKLSLTDNDQPDSSTVSVTATSIQKCDDKDCTPLYYAVLSICGQSFLRCLLEHCCSVNDVIGMPCGLQKRSVLMQQVLEMTDNRKTLGCFLKFLKDSKDNQLWFHCDYEGKNILHYCFKYKMHCEDVESLAILMGLQTWEELILKADNKGQKPLDYLDYSCEKLFHFVEERLLGDRKLSIGSLTASNYLELEKSLEKNETWKQLFDWFCNGKQNLFVHKDKDLIEHCEYTEVGESCLDKLAVFKPNSSLEDHHKVAVDLQRNDIRDICESLAEFLSGGLSTLVSGLSKIEKDKFCFYLGKRNPDILIYPEVYFDKFVKYHELEVDIGIVTKPPKRNTNTRNLFFLLDQKKPNLSLQTVYAGLVELGLKDAENKLKQIINKKFVNV